MNTIDEMIAPLVERLATRVEDKWINSRYEIVKAAAMTPKGDFGEEVTATLIKELVGMPAEIINGGKGEFDILTESKVTFENKLATEDTHGGFQFNGLKNDLWFGIWTKKEVEELTTSMTKDGSDSFKLSARKSARAKYSVMPLTPENFKREVSKIV